LREAEINRIKKILEDKDSECNLLNATITNMNIKLDGMH
jgi:hypothetical protein